MNGFVFPYTYIFLSTGTGLYLFSHSFRKVVQHTLTILSKQSKYKIALLCAILTLFFGILRIQEGLGWDGDGAQFLAQARALVTNTVPAWLEKSKFLYEHTTDKGLGTIVYPWGESFLLAPLYKLFGYNLVAFKVVGVFILSFAMFVLCLLFYELFPPMYAIAISVFCAINNGFLLYVNEILSDYLYMLFTFLSILCVLKYLKNNRPLKYAIWIGILSFCAVISRSLAFSVLVALGFMDLAYAYRVLRYKEYKDSKDLQGKVFVASTPYVVFAILYILLNRLLPIGGGLWIFV